MSGSKGRLLCWSPVPARYPLPKETSGGRPGGGQSPQGQHHPAPARHARLRDEGVPALERGGRRRLCSPVGPRLRRRGRLGHHRHHRLLWSVEPHGQCDQHDAQPRVLHARAGTAGPLRAPAPHCASCRTQSGKGTDLPVFTSAQTMVPPPAAQRMSGAPTRVIRPQVWKELRPGSQAYRRSSTSSG